MIFDGFSGGLQKPTANDRKTNQRRYTCACGLCGIERHIRYSSMQEKTPAPGVGGKRLYKDKGEMVGVIGACGFVLRYAFLKAEICYCNC